MRATHRERRAFLRELADWVADQLDKADASGKGARPALRIPIVKASEDERAFAQDELRAMKTPKRKGRAA